MRLRLYALLSLAPTLASTSVHATPVTFFGEDLNLLGDPHIATPTKSTAAHNAFFANLSGTQTQTFESYSEGTNLPLTIGFGSAGEATLTDPTDTSAIASGSDNGGRFPISGSNYLRTGAGSGFTLTFSAPIAAFGFYATDVGDYGGALSLALGGPHPQTIDVGNATSSFGGFSGSALYFGLYDTTNSFTSVTFNNTGSGGVDVFGFDDFTIGSVSQVTPAAATPEPSSFLLIGTGLTALLGLHRFRHN